MTPEEMSLEDLEREVESIRREVREWFSKGAIYIGCKMDFVLRIYEKELAKRYHELGRYLSDH